jgi:signal transduction histidine kinase
MLAPGGGELWILAQVAEECDSAGRLLGYVGTLTDITARKTADDVTRRLADELELRVAERAAELEATVRELDSFSYTVSHDLRAPLRSINGFSQLILDESGEQLPPQARGYLERVVVASRRMSEMIEGLLDLARVARTPLRGEWVDVSALAESLFEELRAEEPARVVEVLVRPGIRLWGDPTLLRIAVQNLAQNAWKFTRGTDGAQILVAATEGGDGVAFRDNGAGFDMARVDKLFRAFERLHATDVFPGSGIGLATLHRIVTRHGGLVWASGSVGEGACFAFSVPPGPYPDDTPC